MITVIGLGEIGIETFKELCKKRKDIFGVDINKNKLDELRKKGFNVGSKIPKSDIYIICVYLTEQVMDVLKKIEYKNKPLVIIESTIKPGTYKKIIEWKNDKNLDFDLVLFPHRFNPNDPEHHVFNLNRVIGGDKKAVKKAIEFYKEFMPLNLIHITTPEIAELTKPMENTYRFIEIAIAEEIKMLCEEKGIDFNELRKAMNTKWNINIKEARDGIGGKCLPKDTALINNFFENNRFINTAIKADMDYKENLKKKEFDTRR